MTTLSRTKPPCTRPVSTDDKTTHIFCCDRNTALCGYDISTAPEVPDGVGHDCIVCLDLETKSCPRCGSNPGEAS